MIGFILSIFFIYLLYHYFLSNNNSSSNNNNNQSQQQQGDQRKKKILSSNAQILQNILNFPENKERITISLENVISLPLSLLIFSTRYSLKG